MQPSSTDPNPASTPTLPLEAELLLRGNARRVLERITPGDPLGLRPRVAQALAGANLLLDADRALLLTLARVARYARRWSGRPALSAWLDAQVDEALAELVREDDRRLGLAEAGAMDEGEPDGEPGEDRTPQVLRDLAGPLGLAPRALWAACHAHNLQGPKERQAFAAIVLCGDTPEALAARLGVTPSVVARRARRALDAVLDAAAGEDAKESTGEDAR